MYEINEDPDYSIPTQILLRNLFTTFRVVEAVEMTLSANEEAELRQSRRLKFRPQYDPHLNYSIAGDYEDFFENADNGMHAS